MPACVPSKEILFVGTGAPATRAPCAVVSGASVRPEAISCGHDLSNHDGQAGLRLYFKWKEWG